MSLDIAILFTKSIITGIVIAMPLGPICMILIKKTLESGLYAGIAIAIGAACADAVYSGVAGLAMASVAQFITQHKFILRLVSKGVMGCVFVSELINWSSSQKPVALSTGGKIALGFQIFLMTLANPVTILIISSIFLTMEIHFTNIPEITTAITGIFLGSTLWCSSLAYATVFAKKYLPGSFISALKWLSLSMLAAFVIFI